MFTNIFQTKADGFSDSTSAVTENHPTWLPASVVTAQGFLPGPHKLIPLLGNWQPTMLGAHQGTGEKAGGRESGTQQAFHG